MIVDWMWKVTFLFYATLLAFGLDLPMAGGISKIEDADNDEEFQRVLQFAVIQHNNGTNDTVLHQVTKVLLAESQ
ncbi:hypothetical protein XENORESO_001674, partial [Xenotaenia resolanae]